MKKKVINIILFIIAIVITKAIGTGLRVLSSMIEGQHGAPSFVTPAFQTFALICLILFIAAYYLLGKYIPIQNRILRGVVYSVLFLATDYLPQVLGMSGGESTFISPDALSLATILTDSVGYLLNGAVLGYFIVPKEVTQKKECKFKQLLLACLISMICFPVLLGIFEVLMGMINPQMYCIHSFGIVQDSYVSFYILFYLFQAVSGLLMVVFYRFSEYNRTQSSWFRFATVFGLFLWLPVVLIVMFFGVNAVVTICWGIMMVAAIYADTWLFAKFVK